MTNTIQQLIYFFAGLLVVLTFIMLTQRRVLNLIRLLALQGFILAVNMAFVAYSTGHAELFASVILTLIIKVWLIPYVLYRLLIHLNIRGKVEQLFNVPTILLCGFLLVLFAFYLSLSISTLSIVSNREVLTMALASVFLSSFMMIVKRKALTQVIALLSLENSLFFAASSATHGMPFIVELGIAFDVLIGLFIFGIFFFQIRSTFDSFDLTNLEQLKEE